MFGAGPKLGVLLQIAYAAVEQSETIRLSSAYGRRCRCRRRRISLAISFLLSWIAACYSQDTSSQDAGCIYARAAELVAAIFIIIPCNFVRQAEAFDSKVLVSNVGF